MNWRHWLISNRHSETKQLNEIFIYHDLNGRQIKTSSYNQSHEGSRRFKNKHPTARIFSRGAHSSFSLFFFVKALNEIIGSIGKVVGGNTMHYELPLSKIIKFQLWWKPMVYVLIRAYLRNLSWKKCSKKIFVIGKNWKSDQKISGLLSKYFINWS